MQVGATGWIMLSRARPLQVNVRSRTGGIESVAERTDAAAVAPNMDRARTQVQQAWSALASAVRGISNESRSVITPLTFRSGPISARVSGLAARVATIEAIASSLSSTVAVNTSSSRTPGSLGIDSTATFSRLSSALLGLDVSSPEAASVLRSASDLGLDLSSASSILRSSTALGLDVSTPEAASTLRSATALGLDTTSPETASTIESYEDVNTSTTSYSPSLAFSSGSSVATLSGTYAGTGAASTATSLTVRALTSATLSTSIAQSVRFEVRDQDDALLLDETVSVKAGERVYLGDDIGLHLSFGSGSLVDQATATSTVSTSPAVLDVDAAFDATDRNLRPRFDGGAMVTTGSFSIGGTSVAVIAGDSISSVIARINASAAGVTASFTGGRLRLATNDPSSSHIRLGSDTTGFLSAMKLGPRDEEINTHQKSYAESQLAFSAGTSTAVLSGEFLGVGAYANASLLRVKVSTFLVTTISASTARTIGVRVEDQNGNALFDDTVSVRAGDRISLGPESGLSLSFTAGTVWNNATASTTVSHTPADVDPNAVFDAADPDLRPRFNGGALVTAGSFKVNGTTVIVNANDTIAAVLARINATVSGVTATMSDDRITIVDDATSHRSVLTDDTSGFLAATKLTAAATQRGDVHDHRQALTETAVFASVTDGSFTVDGHTIAVDADTDTVETIVARINASGARVTASYDQVQDRMVLDTSFDSEDGVPIGDDTSGFLAAALLDPADTIRGNVHDDQQVLAETTQFAAVTTGSFTINGIEITVDRDADTLQSLLDRINTSGAGVTAIYDADDDQVVLTTITDSEDDITVADDTTGFLVAAHLGTGNTVRGKVRDDTEVLSGSALFSGVSSGSFDINGQTITVDVDVDTLQSVVTKINAAGAGVTAALDEPADRIVLTSSAASEDAIELGGDSTGLLAALSLDSADTEIGNIDDDEQVLSRVAAFAGTSSGTFELNGATITVDVDVDTVSSLIARINGAAAGVTASFDDVADRIVLLADTVGEEPITLSLDSSGFLLAAGLDSNETVLGRQADESRPLGELAAFSSVRAGSFEVAGVEIAVDPTSDSITDIVARINASGADALATFDSVAGTITITDGSGTAPVSLTEDSSGFVAAAKVATMVDIDRPFDQDPGDGSLFDQPHAVGAGTFEINGTAIAVAADDTIAGVLAKIEASAAGVDATYDASTRTVRLESRSAGETPVTVGNDTSGFLAAMKLDATAESVIGQRGVSSFSSPLVDLDDYASVQTGTISVNGRTVDVDPMTTTIDDIIGELSGIGGVDVSLDEATGAISIVARDAATTLSISDSSGLLSVFGITSGNVQATPGAVTTSIRRSSVVVSNTEETARAITSAMDTLNEALFLTADVDQVRFELRSALEDALSSMAGAGLGGLRLSGEGAGLHVSIDHAALRRSLERTKDDAGVAEAYTAVVQEQANRIAEAMSKPIRRLVWGPNGAKSIVVQTSGPTGLAALIARATAAYRQAS